MGTRSKGKKFVARSFDGRREEYLREKLPPGERNPTPNLHRRAQCGPTIGRHFLRLRHTRPRESRRALLTDGQATSD